MQYSYRQLTLLWYHVLAVLISLMMDTVQLDCEGS